MLELPSPSLIVLVGPPGSGKSTWAAQLEASVVSSDALRALTGEGEHDLRASVDAFAVLDDVVERRMKRRLTTVIDSLGTDPQRRTTWRALAERHGVPCVAVIFDVPAAQVRKQNRSRPERVPDEVLRKQLAEWPGVVDAVRSEPFHAVHVAESTTPAAVVPPSMMRRAAGAVGPAAASVEPGTGRLQFGLQLPRFVLPGGPPAMGAQLRAIAAAADRAGLDSLWVMDHFRQIPMMGPAWEDMLESWTTLAHLAACTSTIRLGTMVTGITYRNVGHLGKIVATLDVLSGGRAICGVGLGWFADEHRAYGWTFPSVSDRYALLEDALLLLPQLWGKGAKPFRGRVLDVPDTTCYPRPLQARVPILVGGSGERRTLRLVAAHADACNLFGEPDVVARKVAVLRSHCAELGRDPAEISVTHLSTALVADDAAGLRDAVRRTCPPRRSPEQHAAAVHAGTIEQHVDRVARLVAAGVDHVIVSLPDIEDPAAVGRWAAVASATRQR